MDMVMKKRSLINTNVFVAGLLMLLGHTMVLAESESERLAQIIDAEWQARLENNPEMATNLGLETGAGKLTDVSEQGRQHWLRVSERFLEQLAEIDASKLQEQERINLQILKAQLQHRVAQLRFKAYQIPFLVDWGFHTELFNLAKNQAFKSLKDYQHYVERLSQVGNVVRQHMINMRAGLARGFSMPKVVLKGFDEVIAKQAEVPLDKHPLWQPFVEVPTYIDADAMAALKRRAETIIDKEIRQAYRDLYAFFKNEYIPKARSSLAAYELPDGKAYYAQQIRHYTTLDMSPQQIHQIGLDEVKRIRGEMQAIIEKIGFKGGFKAFLNYLRTSPKFYAKTPEALLKEAAYIAKKMDGQLPRFFKRLPRQPYTVEPVPEDIAPKYTTGRYVGAPLNSTRPGIYWVNTYALDKRPLYVLEALTLHEAVPGHHLQIALTQELENLPQFRRQSYISAFGEGWALYCERLGLEAGFYQDPYADFGRLTYEMWRAARLVIDTGIHAMGWTREQAIKLLEENSALSTHNIRTEVDRYISWPGQALSYKLGELKIRELRARAEEQLGEQFDIREFHDKILENGPVPLDVLEQIIDTYIKQKFKGL